MLLAGKVAPSELTVKLRALVYSKGCAPSGYIPLRIGKSAVAVTKAKKLGNKLPALVTRKVVTPLSFTLALLPLASSRKMFSKLVQPCPLVMVNVPNWVRVVSGLTTLIVKDPERLMSVARRPITQ